MIRVGLNQKTVIIWGQVCNMKNGQIWVNQLKISITLTSKYQKNMKNNNKIQMIIVKISTTMNIN